MTLLRFNANMTAQKSPLNRFGRVVFAGGFAITLAACVQPDAPTSVDAEDVHSVSTVKPGASLKFTHALRGTVSLDAPATVDITVDEKYSGGALWLQATGDDGLEVLSGSAPVRFDMYSVSQHKWSVRFSAHAEGVHYLNVFATVEPDGRSKSMRSYAVRVEVGGGAGGVQRKSNGAVSQSADGEAVIILDAEEEIIE